MHLEPEANLTMPFIRNQLTVVQILALSLPSGWKLVLKEHPATFNLDTRTPLTFCGILDFLNPNQFTDATFHYQMYF